jgi:hypothetical protein
MSNPTFRMPNRCVPLRLRREESDKKNFSRFFARNPLINLVSHERIQGNPNEGGQDPTHTQTWGKSLANSRRGHRLRTIGNVARLSLYKRQSCSYLAPATVLIATLSIIANVDNNATLKPARRSPIEAGDMPLDMARRAAIPLPASRSAAAGGRRSETRREFRPRSRSGTSRRSRASRKEATPGRGRAGDRNP